MNQSLRIGIIGDYDPNRRSHTATNGALHHAANALSVALDITWLPTTLELDDALDRLKGFHALWCAPGSPYKSTNGALRAIRFCREHGWPFIGT